MHETRRKQDQGDTRINRVQCVLASAIRQTPMMMTTKMKISIGADLICLQKLLFVCSLSRSLASTEMNTFTTVLQCVRDKGFEKMPATCHIKLYINTHSHSYIFLGGQTILKVVFAFAIDVANGGVVWG